MHYGIVNDYLEATISPNVLLNQRPAGIVVVNGPSPLLHYPV